MGWGFVWLMLVLKIPIAMLLYIVWWAIKQSDEEPASGTGDGGAKVPSHPRDPYPRPPRRGPHGDPEPQSPPRVRVATVKAREHQP